MTGGLLLTMGLPIRASTLGMSSFTHGCTYGVAVAVGSFMLRFSGFLARDTRFSLRFFLSLDTQGRTSFMQMIMTMTIVCIFANVSTTLPCCDYFVLFFRPSAHFSIFVFDILLIL